MIIVLEGCNGVGKSTTAKFLSAELSASHIEEMDPPAFMIGVLKQNAFYLAESFKLIYVLLTSLVTKRPVVVERSLLSPAIFESARNHGKSCYFRRRAAIFTLRALNYIHPSFAVIVMTQQDFHETKRRHGTREPRFGDALLERIHRQYALMAQENWIIHLTLEPSDTFPEVCEAILLALKR